MLFLLYYIADELWESRRRRYHRKPAERDVLRVWCIGPDSSDEDGTDIDVFVGPDSSDDDGTDIDDVVGPDSSDDDDGTDIALGCVSDVFVCC